MSEKTTDMGPPIRHPSICLIKRLLAEKTDSFVNFINNFLKNFTRLFNSLLVYIRFRVKTQVFVKKSMYPVYWSSKVPFQYYRNATNGE